jgi:hypothetical protein
MNTTSESAHLVETPTDFDGPWGNEEAVKQCLRLADGVDRDKVYADPELGEIQMSNDLVRFLILQGWKHKSCQRKNRLGDGRILAAQYATDHRYPDYMIGIEWAPSVSGGVQTEYVEMAKRFLAQCQTNVTFHPRFEDASLDSPLSRRGSANRSGNSGGRRKIRKQARSFDGAVPLKLNYNDTEAGSRLFFRWAQTKPPGPPDTNATI